MKLIASGTEFSKNIGAAARMAAARTVTGALSGVLINAADNCVTYTGYDMDAGVIIRTTSDVVVGGAIIVADPKLTAEVTGKEDGELVIQTPDIDTSNSRYAQDAARITVTAGDENETHYPAIAAEEYPKIGTSGGNLLFETPAAKLSAMLKQTAYAAGNTGVPEMNGVRFERKGGTLWLCGTDGVRLAIRNTALDEAGNDYAVTVPIKTITELTRHLADNQDERVKATLSKNIVFFEIGGEKDGITLFTRINDGKYLDYRHISEFEPDLLVKFDVLRLLSVVEREIPFIPEKLRSPVVFEFKGGAGSAVQVTLSVRTQNGFKREVVYADVLSGNADGFKIAFNPKYLADALRNADGGLTRIAFRKAENPIRLTPDDEERENLYKYIVVPVRL